jgi:ABC-type transport system involved in cytochrome bd biosynthesis fused ATPase/permease subunit
MGQDKGGGERPEAVDAAFHQKINRGNGDGQMKNLLSEIAYDVNFLKGHKLQPAWFKVLKVFILLGVIAGFILLFGWQRALVFTVVFLLLMLAVHLIYRINTRKFTRNWLDFIVVEDTDTNRRQGIGMVYYSWIVLNAALAFLISRIVL